MSELLPLGVAILGLILIVPKILRERHYVLRDSSTDNGIILLVNGLITFFISGNTLFLVSLVVAGAGILTILGTSQRQSYGTFLGSGLVTLILLVVLLLFQLKYLGFISIF